MALSHRTKAWGIVALIATGTTINYLSRNSLAVLSPQLQAQMHFGAKEYSYVVGAFQIAYTVMQPVCGWVLDRLGARFGFALFAAIWSLAGAAHALAGGWRGLAAARGLLGASEASAIPGGMKGISEWFAPEERSQAVGWFNAGTSLGAMLAPPMTVALTLAYGWKAAFVASGALGLLWAIAWLCLYRTPASARLKKAVVAGPGVRILLTRRYWAIAIPRFLAEPAWQTFNFWIPLYLVTERHWDLKQIALFAWMPFLAADLGGILGGYLSPFFMKRFRIGLLPARQAAMVMGALLMIAPGLVALSGDAYGAIALLCVGGFAHQVISITINTLSADLFATKELATANGFVGAAGWTGGLLFSLLIGQVQHLTGYGPLFACLSLFDLMGAVVLLLMLRGIAPIDHAAEEEN
jgi:ACS family hexuronate transporter-like MFS transporter